MDTALNNKTPWRVSLRMADGSRIEYLAPTMFKALDGINQYKDQPIVEIEAWYRFQMDDPPSLLG